MMNYKKITTLICGAFIAVASLSARTILFDIHGVLLKESIGCYVKAKVMEAMSATHKGEVRGLRDHKLFKMLCKLMAAYKPLGNPSVEFLQYKAKCEALEAHLPENKRAGVVPYETYLLFNGEHAPEYIHEKPAEMVDKAVGLDATERLLMKTLVDAIFNRRELVDATMAPLHEGISLLKTLAADPENKVYVCSNAPESWVKMYHEFFPEIFGNTEKGITGLIPADRVLSSGGIGHLKPLYESFAPISSDAKKFDLFLIDDTFVNVAGAQELGINGAVFDKEEVHEVVAQLRALDVINDEQVITINLELAKEFHERSVEAASSEKNPFF